jgi:hypothetical protein
MNILHEHENNQDTESFLKSNGKKFQGDCLTVMKLLYSGKRLSGHELQVTYGLHDRRLRDCYNARPDVVKREWVLNDAGKRMYVEYFINVPKPPTKEEVVQKWRDEAQQFWDEFQNEPLPQSFIQKSLFL